MKKDLLIEAGNIHRNIRHDLFDYLDTSLKTDYTFLDITEFIESRIKLSTQKYISPIFNSQINDGIAFPVGLSKDYIVAHDTLGTNDPRMFNKFNNILKIDYGVQIRGNIVDAARSYSESKRFKPLIDATREAVLSVIPKCRPETYIRDIQDEAAEIICSYEFEGTPLKAISNVCGHNISDYTIHAGKSFYAHSSFQPVEMRTQRMEADETWAIEFYATNGNPCPIILNSTDVDKHNHFMVTNKKRLFQYKNRNTLEITKILKDNIHILPFSQRDILRNSKSEFNVNAQLQQLFDDQIVTIFPTIYDPRKGIYTSQYEDTIHILESETINLTG
jgi:methionyl aminopeptidase